MTTPRVIVCGSRDWTDEGMMRFIMEGLVETLGPYTVVHGAARGADRIAGEIARSIGLEVEEHPADWTGQGRAAGPRRNQLMMRLGATIVVAFKDGFDLTLSRGGTEHMISLAKEAGVEHYVFHSASNVKSLTASRGGSGRTETP